MNDPPSVFISCVSPEFRQTRSKVANILTGLAYTPVFQEIFGTQSGDLRQVLRNKIDACAGLIQIVGHGYGAEPPTVDANYGRVSYTQFEFLYAREKTKKRLGSYSPRRLQTVHEDNRWSATSPIVGNRRSILAGLGFHGRQMGIFHFFLAFIMGKYRGTSRQMFSFVILG